MGAYDKEYKTLVTQFGWLVLLSAIIAVAVSRAVGDTSCGMIFSSTLVLGLLLYPILFLRVWVRSPPESLFIRSFVHLITLPSILYYILLGFVFIQFLLADPSYEAFLMFTAVTGIAIYLICRYVQFVQRT